MKKVFLVGALMFSMLLISCPNTKEKPSIPKVNTTKVKSNNAITLTIENATESTIARINIKTTKNIFDDTNPLLPGETKSTDLEMNVEYTISLFDDKDNSFEKAYLTTKEQWQKISIEDKDFSQGNSKTNKLKKIFGIGIGSTSNKTLSKKTAVILVNQTGKDIDRIEVVQGDDVQSLKDTLEDGNQKTLDIEQNIGTSFIFHSANKFFKKKYEVSEQLFKSDFKVITITKDNLVKNKKGDSSK